MRFDWIEVVLVLGTLVIVGAFVYLALYAF